MSASKFLFLLLLLLISVHSDDIDDSEDSEDSDDDSSMTTPMPTTITLTPTASPSSSPTIRTRRPSKSPTTLPPTQYPTSLSPTNSPIITPSPTTFSPTTEAPSTSSPTTFSPTPERLPAVGESCRDKECGTGLSCNDGFICVPCGQFDTPCCDTSRNAFACDGTLVCEFVDPGLTLQRCREEVATNSNNPMQAGEGMDDQQQHGWVANNGSVRAPFFVIATLAVALLCMLIGACLMIGCWRGHSHCHRHRSSDHTAVADNDQDIGEGSVMIDEYDADMILSRSKDNTEFDGDAGRIFSL